jgi:hypothetical protein
VSVLRRAGVSPRLVGKEIHVVEMTRLFWRLIWESTVRGEINLPGRHDVSALVD